jgi:hypothetical protein
MKEQQVDPRQSDLIDLTVRLVSPVVVLWIRPFGALPDGFWPTLLTAIFVSFVAAGALWLVVEHHFAPFRGVLMAEPPGRLGLFLGAIAGFATLFVVARVLSVPGPGQKLQWDDGMFRVAVAFVCALYVAGGLAIWTGTRLGPVKRPAAERPHWAELVDLIRRHADMDALAWLAREPDDSALAIANSLSHSSDPDVRKWIASNASIRLGPRVADMLERMASTDASEDVADRAVDRLVEVAPERCQAFWSTFRTRLRSRDEVDVELAAWKLLAMRDPQLGEELAEVLATWPESEYIRQSFQVVEWCLAGDREEIVKRVRMQDLALLPWLVKAAFFLDDEDIWEAIAQAAERGSDHRVQRHYARALRERYSSLLPDLGD